MGETVGFCLRAGAEEGVKLLEAQGSGAAQRSDHFLEERPVLLQRERRHALALHGGDGEPKLFRLVAGITTPL